MSVRRGAGQRVAPVRLSNGDIIPPFAKRDEVEYPESDGKPMAETDVHRNLMAQLIDRLEWRYRDEPNIYVSGNLLFYYIQGDPTKVRAPDVFVVKGIEKRQRRLYKLWEEGVAPCVVIELTSKSTRREDQTTKFELYGALGVREYFLFDPLNEYLRPPLQGYRLKRGRYEVINPDERRRLKSVELDVWLERDEAQLRLWDVATRVEVLDSKERAEIAVKHAEAETARANAAAAHAEAEAARAAAEAARAVAEAARAAAAEAELAVLRAVLARRSGHKK